MKLYIKHMVSLRCKLLVKSELDKLGLKTHAIDLGEVDLEYELSESDRNKLQAELLKSGLELMDDKVAILIEKIKNTVVEMIHYADEVPKVNFSDYLSEKLDYDYKYLSELFTKTKGMTIEHYIILHKVERVKELIMYNELSLTEIAWKLHYSSVAHLSNQFKKITGLTPTFFRTLGRKSRKTLESL